MNEARPTQIQIAAISKLSNTNIRKGLHTTNISIHPFRFCTRHHSSAILTALHVLSVLPLSDVQSSRRHTLVSFGRRRRSSLTEPHVLNTVLQRNISYQENARSQTPGPCADISHLCKCVLPYLYHWKIYMSNHRGQEKAFVEQDNLVAGR